MGQNLKKQFLVVSRNIYHTIQTWISYRPRTILFLLLFFFFIQGYSSSYLNSVTGDEFAHFPAGLFYWKTGNFEVYCQNPPLIKLIASFPLLFSDSNLPKRFMGRWGLGKGFMILNKDIYHLLFVRGRTMILLLTILMTWLLFIFASDIFGVRAAIFSVFLLTFSPNIMAYSYLITTDIGASFGILLALYVLWKYLHHSSYKMAVLCGIAFGIAQLTKFSSLILLPAFPILIGLYEVSEEKKIKVTKILSGMIIILLVGVLVINTGYLFHGAFTPMHDYSFHSHGFKAMQSFCPEWLPVPLPKDYMIGLDRQKFESDERPVKAYLFGRLSSKGWWYYYPVAFLFKTPIPILVIFLWVIWLNIIRVVNGKKDFFFIYIMTFIAIYFFFFSISVINLGIRYLLPIYPLILLLSGYLFEKLNHKKIISIAVLSIWLIMNMVMIYPHHLSFYNECAGGPDNGYRFLADSNIDWGQDLIFLKRYMQKHQLDFVYLSHFGLVDPAVYGIQYKSIPSRPTNGTIAISINHLLGIFGWKKDKHSIEWLKNYKSYDKAGHSILIYKITD